MVVRIPESESNVPEQEKLRFEALLKEAELVRDESLLCIDKIRKLAIIAVGISGASLPIIASLLTNNLSDDTPNNGVSLAQRFEQNSIIIQFLCFGISAVCAAILQIYVGIFKQIFSFAKYQRQVISPNLNQLESAKTVQKYFNGRFGSNRNAR